MKKIFLTSLLIVSALWTQNALAATSGSCAPTDQNGNEIGSCTWTLDGDTLTISGNGPMKDYGTVIQNGYVTTDAPWNDRNADRHTGSLYQIKNVIVEDGITNIGNRFMSGSSYLSYVKIGDDVKTIGVAAFYVNGWNGDLKVDFGKNVEIIKASAFHSSGLKDVILPEKLKVLESYALWAALDEEIIIPSSVETIVFTALPISHNLKVLCDSSKATLCQKIVDDVNNTRWLSEYAQNLSVDTYEKQYNRYIFDGLAYKSIADYYNNEPVKRSYTPAEAAKVVGDTNTLVFYFK